MSLLTGAPRQASVLSLGECEVVCISKADLEPLFNQDPNAISALAVALTERSMANREARDRYQEKLRVRRHLDSQEQARLLDRIREFFRSKA
jgi:CRP-like cAMP-binding protein